MDLSKISDLNPRERAKVVKAYMVYRKQQYEDSYYEFFKDAWKVIEPTEALIDSPHIKYICDILQYHGERLANGEDPEYKTIIINLPPGASKSTIVTKIFPAWLWIKKPSLRIINSSYSADLSTDHSGKTKAIVTSQWYKRLWGEKVKLSPDQKAVSNYMNTATGTRVATSTGGIATGKHCHLWIDDDPLNVKRAYSEKLREAAADFSNKTVPSRIVSNGFRIIVAQRLHQDDPPGLELAKSDKKPILHICLPATISDMVRPKEAKKIYSDEGFLLPQRFDKIYLDTMKESLSPFDYAGQYDQNPVPQGGGFIKTDWFKYISERSIPTLTLDMWIDGAYTKKKHNDPTGILITGFHRTLNRLYILNFINERLEMPELLRRVQDTFDMYNFNAKSRIFVEPKASGKSLVQMLNRDTPLPCIEIKGSIVQDGKEGRIHTAAPYFQAGKIVCVKGTWNNEFMVQLTSFPAYRHDEAVDLAGYVCSHYFQKKKRGIRW